MKKLLLISILILPLSIYASDVYYCSDDEAVGFDPTENFQKTAYHEKKFKVLVDFYNLNINIKKGR